MHALRLLRRTIKTYISDFEAIAVGPR